MAEIVNRLQVYNTKSKGQQICSSYIPRPDWIFSYKCCEVEDGLLKKGGDYAFTLTFGNMGECRGRTSVWDYMRISGIGGVRMKPMDIAGDYEEYNIDFLGWFYYPANQNYYYLFISLEDIMNYGLEFVICQFTRIYIFVEDKFGIFPITLEPHTIKTLGFLWQVEDVYCDNCPIFGGFAEAVGRVPEENSRLVDEIFDEEFFKLPPDEIQNKLKELEEKFKFNPDKIINNVDSDKMNNGLERKNNRKR